MENDDAQSDFTNAETPSKSTVVENVDFAAGDGTQLKIRNMKTVRTQRQPKRNLCGMPSTSNKPEFDPFLSTGPMEKEHEVIPTGAVEPDHVKEVKLSWLPNEIWKLATDKAYLQAVIECQKEAQAKKNPIASAGRGRGGRSKGFTDIFKPVVLNATADVATVTVVDDNLSLELPVYSDAGEAQSKIVASTSTKVDGRKTTTVKNQRFGQYNPIEQVITDQQHLDLSTTAEELWTQTTAIESIGRAAAVSDREDDLYFDKEYLQAVNEYQKEALAKRNPIAPASRCRGGHSKGFTDIFKPVALNATVDAATVTVETVVDDNASVELPVYSDDGDQNLDLNATAEELWTDGTTAIESIGQAVSDPEDDLYFDNDLSDSVVEPEQQPDATAIFIEQYIRDLQAFKMDELIQRKQDEAIAEIKREKRNAQIVAQKAAYKARKEARERRKLIRIQARHEALQQQWGVQSGNEGSRGAGASTNYSPQPPEKDEETPIQVNFPAVFINSNFNNTVEV